MEYKVLKVHLNLNSTQWTHDSSVISLKIWPTLNNSDENLMHAQKLKHCRRHVRLSSINMTIGVLFYGVVWTHNSEDGLQKFIISHFIIFSFFQNYQKHHLMTNPNVRWKCIKMQSVEDLMDIHQFARKGDPTSEVSALWCLLEGCAACCFLTITELATTKVAAWKDTRQVVTVKELKDLRQQFWETW